MNWETALLLLRLQVLLLTGLTKHEIFEEMSEDQRVTQSSWDIYFEGTLMDDVIQKDLSEGDPAASKGKTFNYMGLSSQVVHLDEEMLKAG